MKSEWQFESRDRATPGMHLNLEHLSEPELKAFLEKYMRLFEGTRLFCATVGPVGEKAIMEYLANHNENPRPFVWTANADLILERVKKVCERISNSGH